MHLKFRLWSIMMFVFTLFTLIVALSPDLNAQAPAAKKDKNFMPGIDVAGGVMGQMTFARSPVSVDVEQNFTSVSEKSQSLSPSPAALFTFHQAIRPYLGYNVNYSYTKVKQSFAEGSGTINYSNGTTTPTSFAAYSFNARMNELTVAYAFSGPRYERFRTFAQFGGGGLFFEPISGPFTKEQTRPAMVFGVGVERDLNTHISFRAEYRGLFYKGPDYKNPSGPLYLYAVPQRLFTVTNAPTISLVYRFHGSKESNKKPPQFSMNKLFARDRNSNGD
jgi:opacity protein-like surface antigen